MLPNIMHLLILVKFWCIFILAILKTNPFSLHLYKCNFIQNLDF